MIRRSFTLLLLLFTVAFGTLSAQAVLKFDKKAHDFGEVLRSKPESCKFVVTNAGDKPLIINQVVPSCGCTVAEFTKVPIAPGDSGVVKLTYDAKNQFEGKFSRIASVYSNATNKLERLRIQGIVKND